MSVAPLQLLKTEFNPLVYSFLDNATDQLVSAAFYFGDTGTTPTDAYFSKGALLVQATDGTFYQNSAADGVTPTWVQFTATVPGSNTITTAMLQAASVTLAKLATGIAPSHVAKFGGTSTWSGSGTTKAQAVAGVLSTDLVIATIKTKPTQAAYLVAAVPTTDTITFELSAANTSNDAVIMYTVFRAAA